MYASIKIYIVRMKKNAHIDAYVIICPSKEWYVTWRHGWRGGGNWVRLPSSTIWLVISITVSPIVVDDQWRWKCLPHFCLRGPPLKQRDWVWWVQYGWLMANNGYWFVMVTPFKQPAEIVLNDLLFLFLPKPPVMNHYWPSLSTIQQTILDHHWR